MSSDSFNAVARFQVVNGEELDISKKLLGIMDPILTPSYVTRVYQDISLTFLFISLVSVQTEVKGVMRMCDSEGMDDDKLSSVSWTSSSKLWGYLSSPVPFLSCDLADRLKMSCCIFAPSYSKKSKVASLSVLLRVGVHPPRLVDGECFLYPSSDDIPLSVFSSVGAQDEMLHVISSYYSRGGDSEGGWNASESKKMVSGMIDTATVVTESFPSLKNACDCPHWWIFNYGCYDRAHEFKQMAIEKLEAFMREPRAWNDCRVKDLYIQLISKFPTDIHPGHIRERGNHSIRPMLVACYETRGCWSCRLAINERETIVEDQIDEVSKLRSSSPSPLRSVVNAISGLIFDHQEIPGWVSSAMNVPKMLGY